MKQKLVCPECGGRLRFIKNYHSVECDVSVFNTKYFCIECKEVWYFHRFTRSWTSDSGKFIERKENKKIRYGITFEEITDADAVFKKLNSGGKNEKNKR